MSRETFCKMFKAWNSVLYIVHVADEDESSAAPALGFSVVCFPFQHFVIRRQPRDFYLKRRLIILQHKKTQTNKVRLVFVSCSKASFGTPTV